MQKKVLSKTEQQSAFQRSNSRSEGRKSRKMLGHHATEFRRVEVEGSLSSTRTKALPHAYGGGALSTRAQRPKLASKCCPTLHARSLSLSLSRHISLWPALALCLPLCARRTLLSWCVTMYSCHQKFNVCMQHSLCWNPRKLRVDKTNLRLYGFYL